MGDLVAGGDDLLDRLGCAGRSDREAVLGDAGLLALLEGPRGRALVASALLGHAADGLAQHPDVAAGHPAVLLAPHGALPAVHRRLGARAELAVDAQVVAELVEEVLQDADVLPLVAPVQRPALTERATLVGRAVVVVVVVARGGGDRQGHQAGDERRYGQQAGQACHRRRSSRS
ncbi:MAG: hypothetical protein KY469_22820 [Actinobacteria bacterium]|nr:hypothetical protein [Actinomycetota bacterium]